MKTIDELLDKYYKGETSKAEEQILKDMLCETNSSKKYLEEKIMFEYYQSEHDKNELTDEFDTKILKTINSSNPIKVDFRRKFHRIINIAAIIAVAIGFYVFFQSDQTIDEQKQVSQEDYEGFVQTYNALAKASKYINQVDNNLAKLEVIDEAFEQLDKVTYVEYYNNYIYKVLGD